MGHWCAWLIILTCYPWMFYNQALADVRLTGAGIKWLYCIVSLTWLASLTISHWSSAPLLRLPLLSDLVCVRVCGSDAFGEGTCWMRDQIKLPIKKWRSFPKCSFAYLCSKPMVINGDWSSLTSVPPRLLCQTWPDWWLYEYCSHVFHPREALPSLGRAIYSPGERQVLVMLC